MPCYDERNSPEYVRAESAAEIKRLRRRNDQVTELLCSVMRALPGPYVDIFQKAIPGLEAWWKQHQIDDKKHERKKR